jgi:hypothetical protein
MKTIEIRGFECDSANDALSWANAGGGDAIFIGNKYIVCPEAESDRLAADGIEFAKLVNHEMPDGTNRIMTIPIND